MAWAKSKPMTWEVFQDFCLPLEVASLYQKIIEAKQLVKHVIALPDGTMLIVSMRGTPIKKAKEADEALDK